MPARKGTSLNPLSSLYVTGIYPGLRSRMWAPSEQVRRPVIGGNETMAQYRDASL